MNTLKTVLLVLFKNSYGKTHSKSPGWASLEVGDTTESLGGWP